MKIFVKQNFEQKDNFCRQRKVYTDENMFL